MSKTILIRCTAPRRRDALEETARLALNFVDLAFGPEFPELKASEHIQIHLTALALVKGCHLPETAQDLLEAVQVFGVPIKRIVEPEEETLEEEWSEWWRNLETTGPTEFDMVIDIK